MAYSPKHSPEDAKARLAANSRRYRENHPEKARAATQRWRSANADFARARYKAWRAANPDIAKAAEQRWRAENPERNAANRSAWTARNKDHVTAKRRERYAVRATEIRARKNAERAERKRLLVDLLGGTCVDCGLVPHLAAFEFDHVGDKTANISMLLARPSLFERAKAEALTCELVCANCHRIRTASRTGRV